MRGQKGCFNPAQARVGSTCIRRALVVPGVRVPASPRPHSFHFEMGNPSQVLLNDIAKFLATPGNEQVQDPPTPPPHTHTHTSSTHSHTSSTHTHTHTPTRTHIHTRMYTHLPRTHSHTRNTHSTHARTHVHHLFSQLSHACVPVRVWRVCAREHAGAERCCASCSRASCLPRSVARPSLSCPHVCAHLPASAGGCAGGGERNGRRQRDGRCVGAVSTPGCCSGRCRKPVCVVDPA
jgi:hypothetical protein